MAPNQSSMINEDRISIRDIFLRIGNWIKYLLSSWKGIVGFSLLIAALNITYTVLRDPEYTAETTFVLEGTQSSGNIPSIVSAVGVVDLENGMQDNPLFDTDHIVELYRSFRMLKETFLTPVDFGGGPERLISRFCKENELFQKWSKEPHLENFTFELADEQYTITHDSLLMEVIEGFRDDNLNIDRVSRQLSILSIKVVSEDQLFAKNFNEVLVRTVNAFYAETKTKKAADNLKVLKLQSDSVRAELDKAVNNLAVSSPINRPKAQINVEALGAVYQELTKNLEIAKMNHQNRIPLIQIVDEPILPLPDDKPKLLVLIILSGFLGGFLTVGFYTIKMIYKTIMNDPKYA